VNYHQQYYFKNRKKILAQVCRYAKNNRQKVLLSKRRYYAQNRKRLIDVNSRRNREPAYRLWKRWWGMLQRCSNKKAKGYQNWGGRKIRVCKRWQSFENFKGDMERSFLKHYKKHGGINTTLERIDNDKNYYPSNCKWATMKEQQNNRRNNKKQRLS